MIRASLVVLGLASLMATGPAQAAVTFTSDTVNSNASAYTDYGTDSAGQGFGTQSRTLNSPGSVLATSSAQADSYDDTGDADATADALEQSRASFSSAAAGLFDLSGITSATTSDATSTAEAYSEGQSSTYLFSIDTASVLTIDYNYTESFTNPYFYNSVYVGSSSGGAPIYSSTNQGQNTSGVITLNLDPGAYDFNVYTQVGDDAYASGGASTFGNHEELYQFAISAAPEPSTWLLMIVGIGGVGLALRRKRGRTDMPESVFAA